MIGRGLECLFIAYSQLYVLWCVFYSVCGFAALRAGCLRECYETNMTSMTTPLPIYKREKHFYTNSPHSCESAISFKLTT